jgi:hypothetical protein
MIQLERTIIGHARQQLAELRGSLMLPAGTDRDDDIQSAFWMLSGITMLANLTNSGMTDEAAQTLKAIDVEAAKALTAAMLTNPIRK